MVDDAAGGEKTILPCDCLHQKTIRTHSYIWKELLGGGKEPLTTTHQIGTVGADRGDGCHPSCCLSTLQACKQVGFLPLLEPLQLSRRTTWLRLINTQTPMIPGAVGGGALIKPLSTVINSQVMDSEQHNPRQVSLTGATTSIRHRSRHIIPLNYCNWCRIDRKMVQCVFFFPLERLRLIVSTVSNISKGAVAGQIFLFMFHI